MTTELASTKELHPAVAACALQIQRTLSELRSSALSERSFVRRLDAWLLKPGNLGLKRLVLRFKLRYLLFKLAHVSKVNRDLRRRVAFLAWVQDHYPFISTAQELPAAPERAAEQEF